MRKLGWGVVLSIGLLGCTREDDNLGVTNAGLTRSAWQMHGGEGLVSFGFTTPNHGAVVEYDFATIPPGNDPGWGAAPNGDTIAFDATPSSLCNVLACRAGGQFTYFQTFVDVPANVVVTTFTISFSGIDDGTRTTIFNSLHPGGVVVPGSYVFLGGTGTANLAALVKSGEVNRVVVTHVDDCCVGSYLASAVVVLNGSVVPTGCSGPADCSDGNACTQDVCNQDGSCSNPPLSCDDGDGCTADSCDPASGCAHVEQCPDCGAVTASPDTLWPPDYALVGVDLQGVADPQGQPVTITIDGVTQDEPTNTCGDACPDATGVGTSSVQIRAEREPSGDGRVYHVEFTATDPDGHVCTGHVTVCVPLDLGGTCVDQGSLHDSLTCP